MTMLPPQQPQGFSPLRGLFGGGQVAPQPLGAGPMAPQGGAGFNAYGAGDKVYGQGRMAPNVGPVSPQGQMGYNQRDQMNAIRTQALQNRANGQV